MIAMANQAYETNETKALGCALDAEAGRDIAAAACSAARTAEQAAMSDPDKAPLLEPWGAEAADTAKRAARDSSHCAEKALAIAKLASLSGDAEPVGAAAKQALAAAEQAECLADGAVAAAFAISQAAVVATGKAGQAPAPAPPPPAAKKPDRPLVSAKVWK